MNATPLISVALCVYNGARHLGAQIESVLGQRGVNLEIVAIDDASTDRSNEILRHYAALDSRIRIRTNPHNFGYNANFASAFSECRGAFVAPCDQDDIWHAEKLGALAAAIAAADLAYSDSQLVDEAGRPRGRLSETRRMYAGADPLALVMTNSASGHAMLFRRELLQRAVPFPADVHYDWWLAIVAATGHGIRYVDRPLVAFRRHALAATGVARVSAPLKPRQYLEGRRQLLRSMERLEGPRHDDLAALAATLSAGLDQGRWLGFGHQLWRHRKPLGYILGPRLPALAWRLLLPERLKTS